ncbi:hypothetical protein ACD578_05505 [Microvirga sp. RSM25]|uniref:hypothetical protein n=1 Tax=Microvirga sp. RSM25 TaxID=3273802 RepID=UPI00384DFE9D
MVILYMAVAFIGAGLSCVLLWPYGAAIALVSMPFGGSLVAVMAAVLVYMRTSDETELSDDHASHIDQPQSLQTTESRR